MSLSGQLRSEETEEPDEPLFRLPRPQGAVALRALRLLRRRRWALILLAVIALSLVFVGLGRWQYHRHEGKVARRDVVRANYDAAPRPIDQVLGSENPPPAQQWRPLVAQGHYEVAGQLAVRNRSLDGDAGFEILVPLRLDDGELLVVDRGWVPAADSTAKAPTSIPSAPAGRIEVKARVRSFEPPLTRRATTGQVLRIDRAAVTDALRSAGLSGPVLGGYAVLAAETPAAQVNPTPLPRPDVDLGVHLAYAVQWWIFAIALYFAFAVAAYREAEATTEESPADEHPEPRRAQGAAENADTTPRDVTVGIEDPPFE
jgi:cytochrome oxidase assembly protein ShyY1